jgi:dTDP-4-amino-4,6-dideoxygalactose transaminase/very-short-patch-repair endonuclease
MSGKEMDYIKEAFADNWVVPLGPNVNGFEDDLKRFIASPQLASPQLASPQPSPEGEGANHPSGNSKALPFRGEFGEAHKSHPSGGDLEGASGQALASEVVALSAGTAAVHLALHACGVGPGDEVLVQSFTFCASSHPVTYLGATPVFIDSEKDSWNMDPDLLEEAIKDRIAKTGKKPKAIIPVALYGMPYQADSIIEIANRYDIPVVEDAAEGFGSRFDGRVLGTFGKYGVLSFNGNKMITTSGGGALICNGSLIQPSPEGKGSHSVHTADPMTYGILKQYAEGNRNNPTEAERVLWNALRESKLGVKFRQQHIIEDFIVDFYCAELKLTIELDGDYHNAPEQMKSDIERTARLKELGYIEIRFNNEQVIGDFDGTISVIENFVKALASPNPPLKGRALNSGALDSKSHPLGGDLEGASAAAAKAEIMYFATQAREAYPYYQHTDIGYNYRMSNICAGIGRGQMTIVNDHIAHHKHVQTLYRELLKDVEGVTLHENPSDRYDSNFWLCAVTLDSNLKVVGQEHAYEVAITGAVGGAAGVTHQAKSLHTDCEPNANVEAMRMALDKANIEARPLWKPMHKQPVYANNPAYVNGVSESLFAVGLCLPAGPWVSDDDVRYIVDTIKSSIVK